jgi:hypothetical protein
MNLYRNTIILSFIVFVNVSCVPVNIARNYVEEIPLEGNSGHLFWHTIDKNSPKFQVAFKYKDDFAYKIQSLKIRDDIFEVTINDDILKQNENELIFVDTDISPVTWKVKGDKRTIKFSGGDGAGSFIIKLTFIKENLIDYSILRRELNP